MRASTILRKTRFQFARGGRLQFRVGMPGIVCVSLKADEGLPSLLLVWDEGATNLGASASNGIAAILQWLRAQWGDELIGPESVVIERDSAGFFDHAYVDWKAHDAPGVTWAPLTWPGMAPRTEGAFRGVFGARAAVVLQSVREVLEQGT